jgi:hypothetical protein
VKGKRKPKRKRRKSTNEKSEMRWKGDVDKRRLWQ